MDVISEGIHYFVCTNFSWAHILLNTPRGATLIHSSVVILKQAITDPPLNRDILNMKLWPLITDIHSLTYRNNPHNSRKSSIFNWEVGQKCHKSLQNSGKYSTTVEFHVFEIHTLNANMRLLKSIPFFPRFHEIYTLNVIRADCDDA